MLRILKIIFLFFFLSFLITPNLLLAKPKIVCSNYATYLFSKIILSSVDTEVTMLGNFNLACDHDYLLTVIDLEKLSKADFFIINGVSYEEAYLNEALNIVEKNKNLKVIDASLNIKPIKTEMSNGEFYINSHFFTSPRLAKEMVQNISRDLIKYDSENKDTYQNNTDKFIAIIGELEKQIENLNFEADVLVGHDVFGYLAKDLNINIVAYLEESEHSALSAARIKEILNLVKTYNIAYIILDENENDTLALTLAKETKLKILKLDFLTSGPELLDDYIAYYRKQMENNISQLKKITADKN